MYRPSHILEVLNRKTQEQISRVPRWDCFFMNLSAVNKRAEQTVLMLTYKYVVVVGGGDGREGGGRAAIIVYGSKNSCLIISCNIPMFILPISLLLTKKQKISHIVCSNKSNLIPSQKLLCKPQRSWWNHGSVLRLK